MYYLGCIFSDYWFVRIGWKNNLWNTCFMLVFFLLFFWLCHFYAFLQRSLLSMSVKETVSFCKVLFEKKRFDRYWRSVTLWKRKVGARYDTSSCWKKYRSISKRSGISVIDKLILTHDDTDHVGELPTLSQHFIIKKFISVGRWTKWAITKAFIWSSKNGTEIIEIKHGDRISGYYDLYVLTPFEKGEGRNEDSIGLWMEYNNRRFLFLGDLNQAMENNCFWFILIWKPM